MDHNLSSFAIIELVVRVAQHHQEVGHYVDHTVYDIGVVVKTSRGLIRLNRHLVTTQQEQPGNITPENLAEIARTLRLY